MGALAGSTPYAELTVEDVVRRAGVSRKTFYAHFANKEEVFLAAYDMSVEMLAARVREAIGPHRDFVARLRAGLHELLAMLAAEPDFARLCFVEAMAAGPAAIERRDAAMATFAAMIADNVQTLVPDSELPALAAEALVGGVHQVIYTRIARGETATLPELEPALLYSVLVGCVGPSRAAEEYGRSSG